MLQWTLGCIHLFKFMVLFSSEKYSEVEAELNGSSNFNFFRKLLIAFHTGCISLHSPINSAQEFPFLNNLTVTLFVIFLIIASVTDETWYLIVIFFPLDQWCQASCCLSVNLFVYLLFKNVCSSYLPIFYDSIAIVFIVVLSCEGFFF